ncbi:MAG TPA: YceI family protein [Gemmatimonadaceae bacterium]|nr:YceI family protein [Gemmatimonadaceae bacterium]
MQHPRRTVRLDRALFTSYFAVSLGLVGAATSANAQRAVPSGGLSSATLSFDGHANVGDFVGTTHEANGSETGGASVDSVRGWVEAPVATLVTGNGRRDGDLRKTMEVEKYPTMRFDLERAETADAAAGADSLAAVLHGKLTIHGVTRDIDIPAGLVFTGTDVRVRASFPVALTDYKVTGLTRFLGILSMDEHIVVHIDVSFAFSPTTAGPPN